MNIVFASNTSLSDFLEVLQEVDHDAPPPDCQANPEKAPSNASSKSPYIVEVYGVENVKG